MFRDAFTNMDQCSGLDYSRKKTKGVEDIPTFFEKSPIIFHFFTSTLGIPDKTKLHAWKFYKIVIDMYLGNSTMAKNQDPWKFVFFSWSPMEIPLCF